LGNKVKGSTDIGYTSVLIVTMAVLCLVIFLGYSAYTKFYVTLNDPITIKLSEIDQIYKGEVMEFSILARRFSEQHKYISYEEDKQNYYICGNYSRDLHNLAKDLGFKTKIVTGCPEGNGSCHTWLRIELDFEPQYGQFVDYSKKYPEVFSIEGG
jgi:hypothetical protein